MSPESPVSRPRSGDSDRTPVLEYGLRIPVYSVLRGSADRVRFFSSPSGLNPRPVDARLSDSPVTHCFSRPIVQSQFWCGPVSRPIVQSQFWCGPGRAESVPCQRLWMDPSWRPRGLRLRGGTRTSRATCVQPISRTRAFTYPLILSVAGTQYRPPVDDRRLGTGDWQLS